MSSSEVCIVHAANKLYKHWVGKYLTPSSRYLHICQIESLARQHTAGHVNIDVRYVTKHGWVAVRVSALVNHHEANHIFCMVNANDLNRDE